MYGDLFSAECAFRCGSHDGDSSGSEPLCLPVSNLVCNERADCVDGSDEWGCFYTLSEVSTPHNGKLHVHTAHNGKLCMHISHSGKLCMHISHSGKLCMHISHSGKLCMHISHNGKLCMHISHSGKLCMHISHSGKLCMHISHNGKGWSCGACSAHMCDAFGCKITKLPKQCNSKGALPNVLLLTYVCLCFRFRIQCHDCHSWNLDLVILLLFIQFSKAFDVKFMDLVSSTEGVAKFWLLSSYRFHFATEKNA